MSENDNNVINLFERFDNQRKFQYVQKALDAITDKNMVGVSDDALKYSQRLKLLITDNRLTKEQILIIFARTVTEINTTTKQLHDFVSDALLILNYGNKQEPIKKINDEMAEIYKQYGHLLAPEQTNPSQTSQPPSQQSTPGGQENPLYTQRLYRF